MSRSGRRGPVVLDTNVFGADLLRTSDLIRTHEPMVAGRPAVISFQTVAERHYGARKRGRRTTRLRRLEERIGRAQVVWPGQELVLVYADLRARCERQGHALGQREHDADRWIAATAIRLGIPLLSHDGIFRNAPGLELESALQGGPTARTGGAPGPAVRPLGRRARRSGQPVGRPTGGEPAGFSRSRRGASRPEGPPSRGKIASDLGFLERPRQDSNLRPAA